ncbi:hypothetical protein BJX64DRAFT_108334 [Aspergillus heterothallicus]
MRASRINYPGFSLATHPSVLALLESTCRLTLETCCTLAGRPSSRSSKVRYGSSGMGLHGPFPLWFLAADHLLYVHLPRFISKPRWPLKLCKTHAGEVQSNRLSSFSTISLIFTFQLFWTPTLPSDCLSEGFLLFHLGDSLTEDAPTNWFAEEVPDLTTYDVLSRISLH